MELITTVSAWLIPCFIAIVLVTATFKKVPSYELFVEGGKEGVKMAFSLLPFLVGMIVSISILRSSGALEAFIQLISPLLTMVGIPPDIIPLALVRPISGTAALGMTTELIDTHGPDSFIGRLASTMQGSTDTTLYILTIYFGAIGIKKMRYALKVGLLADLIGIIASIVIVSILFG
ncbi:MAG: spore maturation protein [Bacillota bacterium]|uniref:Spore maturation protein n=1 Tax=Virgibacillus salarius TaxID=447199 RepID=A0A941I8F1_9BACI|nr:MULTISPECIES: spore maturation protein [Bacillaceae]NAZ08227.1 spore maturation protein [Agaribacter marinus]MBR7795514.1 spore maturation protein [Virgibacillus salarius]MCC2249117.1 spore maturation protein [Virgibacillus sp. AGTR]MDY7043420.1 spore maturation protein [Virgibacillus sp. M23]QRZ16976.1 spore maturation protein [Virgibacillus sp. AGTR]